MKPIPTRLTWPVCIKATYRGNEKATETRRTYIIIYIIHFQRMYVRYIVIYITSVPQTFGFTVICVCFFFRSTRFRVVQKNLRKTEQHFAAWIDILLYYVVWYLNTMVVFKCLCSLLLVNQRTNKIKLRATLYQSKHKHPRERLRL